MRRWIIVAICLVPRTATPQAATPSQAALDEAVQLGSMAVLAPICGLREEGWAFDLRRAAILQATRTARPDDPALREAPGSQMVVSALSYAEAEALEKFAETAPETSCGPLHSDPELARADSIVEAFRTMKSLVKPSS